MALPKGYQPIRVKQNQKIMLTDCPNYSKFEKINFETNADVVK